MHTGGLAAMRRVWMALDKLYSGSGYLAAACLVLIFAITMLQVAGRYVGYNPAGLTNYVGYLTGASAFLGLAHTLNKGVHVRVNLFLGMMGRFRPALQWIGMGFSAITGTWFAYYCWRTVIDSYNFGDLSDGLDATPIWIPQLSMAVGSTLLAVAVLDHFSRLILTGSDGIEQADEPL
jgi:TRAP-type C4-dicarboxylate transport system permease small subunit